MKTILIIEDETQVSKIYEEALTNNGFKTVIAESGNKALTLLQTIKPDLILLDIMLPSGMNGFDILENIKSNSELKKIPVIILTNLDSERKTAMEIGASDYLMKADTSLELIVSKVKSFVDAEDDSSNR